MAGMVTAARGWGGRGKGRTETNESGVKPTQCFLAGTQVLMGDKSTKKIEEVKVGDEVLATDPEQGRTSKRKVTALIITEGEKQFTELTIATAGGSKAHGYSRAPLLGRVRASLGSGRGTGTKHDPAH